MKLASRSPVGPSKMEGCVADPLQGLAQAADGGVIKGGRLRGVATLGVSLQGQADIALFCNTDHAHILADAGDLPAHHKAAFIADPGQAFALFLQLRGDAPVALMAADFFIVTEGQQHIALRLEALSDKGFHRFENRHHRAFAVDGATAPDKAIGNRPGEWRVSPQRFGARRDGHHVLMRHQQNRRQLAVLARPAQQDAWAAGGERLGVGSDLWVALRQPLTQAGKGGVAGRQLAGRRADLMRQGRQANGGRQALGGALAIQPLRQADRLAVVSRRRQQQGTADHHGHQAEQDEQQKQ